MSRRIETERLVLRPWRSSDVGAALAIYGEADVTRWLSSSNLPVTTEGMRRRLDRWSEEDTATPSRCAGHWVVHDRSKSSVVGALALGHPPGGESVTIGWALTAAARGRGYAAEAGDALVRWAIHEAGAVEVFALVPPDNARARSTAERIGMEWVTELDLPGVGDHRLVYRIRHGDLDYEEDEGGR